MSAVTVKTTKFGIKNEITVAVASRSNGEGFKKFSVTVNGVIKGYITKFPAQQFGQKGWQSRYATLADAVAELTVGLTAAQSAKINTLVA